VTVIRHQLRIGDRSVSLLEGPAGWGEYSPFPGYPCDPELAHRAALESACDGWPAPKRTEIAVNTLVDAPADVVPIALAGYSCVKVKVGRRDHRADLQLVEAVRDVVGAGVALRVDANGAWDPETALEMIGELSGFGVELVEQPVESIDELAAVRRRSPVPVAADECVRSIEDAQRLAALEAADAIVLKVQPLGGVRQALRVADAAGVPALVTSMRETSVGIAAGLALAAALPALPYACGLVARMPGGDVVRDPLIPVAGRLRVRAVVPDRELVERYEVCS
jgi:O-succinylbenzoate synthase